jgi:hypothetical protein
MCTWNLVSKHEAGKYDRHSSALFDCGRRSLFALSPYGKGFEEDPLKICTAIIVETTK